MEDVKEDNVSWQHMSVLRLLTTLGLTAAVMAAAVYITNSATTGFGLLLTIPLGWFAFAAIMGLGASATIAVVFLLDLILLPVSDDAKEKIYWIIRWSVCVTGMGVLLFLGGQGVIDGLRENRMVPQQALFDQCMTPRTRTVEESYRTCRDGWGSPSIGRRGACSHHGGVVRRWIQRRETYQPHKPEWCRTDSAARSWID
ncbi:MAG: hypothetical protein ACN6O2_13050 [Stenotrophomonas sp.]